MKYDTSKIGPLQVRFSLPPSNAQFATNAKDANILIAMIRRYRLFQHVTCISSY